MRGKLIPLNKMLGNQAETRLWALEMAPEGFRCDDKPIQARKQRLHLTKQQQRPNGNTLQYLVSTLVVLF